MMTNRFSGRADAGDARTYMTVSAVVVQSVTLRVAHQAPTLVVTDRDVARGFITVAAASRLEIAHDGPYVLDFRPTVPVVSAFSVTGPGVAARFGPDGGTLDHRPRTRGAAPLVLDYRLQLAADTRPGVYPWPVALTVLPQ